MKATKLSMSFWATWHASLGFRLFTGHPGRTRITGSWVEGSHQPSVASVQETRRRPVGQRKQTISTSQKVNPMVRRSRKPSKHIQPSPALTKAIMFNASDISIMCFAGCASYAVSWCPNPPIMTEFAQMEPTSQGFSREEMCAAPRGSFPPGSGSPKCQQSTPIC